MFTYIENYSMTYFCTRPIRNILTLILLIVGSIPIEAQTALRAKVTEQDTGLPLIGAYIRLSDKPKIIALTDTLGFFEVHGSLEGKSISISSLGYRTSTFKLAKGKIYQLKPDVKAIQEVIVTAQESRGLTSASTIRKHAMEHLQPSSFSDLLELLPGGRSQDPNLSRPNSIRLREANRSNNEQYATSSLGTSFLIDGAPISSNANLQSLKNAWEPQVTARDFSIMGVDMRSLTTDDISQVEIVRGIPSVEYGDLTSGLIKIERKRGGKDLSLRLKADMGSKLLYLGKGWEWSKGWTLNTSLDYLYSNKDPRNTLEAYQRLSSSLRLGRKFQLRAYSLDWQMNADYGASLDGAKQDPETNGGYEDSFQSDYHRVALSNKLVLKRRGQQWLKAIELLGTSSYEWQDMKRIRYINLQQTTAAIREMRNNSESDAFLLPYSYRAEQNVEGRPLNIFLKANARLALPIKFVKDELLLGADWALDKNLGRGQIFDYQRPLYPQHSLRPRPFSDIPAVHNLSLYAENTLSLKAGKNKFELLTGLRATHLFGLRPDFALSREWTLDPRLNLAWTLPSLRIREKALTMRLSAGIGQHSKSPTIGQLFPDPSYIDLTELNYYHTNEALRRIHVRTYVVDNSNIALRLAHNLKTEISVDLDYNGYRLSCTIFREDMSSGFRQIPLYAPYHYKQYDTDGINSQTITEQPRLEDLPVSDKYELIGRSYTGNGSRTLKEGIEYTLSTKRIEPIHTRLTITGAWFRTTYQNSQEIMERPSTVISNQQIPYVGIYEDTDWSRNQLSNTNFTLDTDIPRLLLGVSLSAQCAWFSSTQRKALNPYPTAYMKIDGSIVSWQEDNQDDTLLRWLVRRNATANTQEYVTPFSMNLNFKVTKKLMQGRINIAMFCNKLWDYTPNYNDGGLVIRRYVDPYFGLETNIKL